MPAMNRRSLRLRLMLAGLATLACALVLGGWGMGLLFERHVERRVALELETDIRELIAGLGVDAEGGLVLSREPGDQRYTQPLSGRYWQIADGRQVVARSRSLWDEELVLPGRGAPEDSYRRIEAAGPGAQELIALQRRVRVRRPTGEFTFTLTAALDRTEVSAAVRGFRGDIFLALAVLGAVLLAAFAAAIGVGLKPLQHLRGSLKELRAGRITRLTGSQPAEVAPLVDDLNAMLEAQETAVEEARARAADLAHGLKTPLTAISVIADDIAVNGDARTARELADYARAMGRHVEQELARARNIHSGPAARPVALTAIVDPLLRTMHRLPRGSDLEWISDIDPALALKVNPDAMSEIVGNLVDNARKWARSLARISARVEDGEVVIEVADDGPGIPAAEAGSVGRRGKRLDETVPGSGIGLSIVTGMVADLGGSLKIDTAPEGGLGARILLPGRLLADVEALAAT